MDLLNTQRNNLFDLISKKDTFSPSQFELRDGSNVVHIGTNYYFSIEKSHTGFRIQYSPGYSAVHDATACSEWYSVAKTFSYWLSYLKIETEAPDKWGRLYEEMKFLKTSPEVSQQMFTHAEFVLLSANIEIIKERINSLDLLPEQIEAMQASLDHVVNLAENLNKFDWTNLLLGTLMSIVIQLNVTKENANALYEIIKQVFKGYFLP